MRLKLFAIALAVFASTPSEAGPRDDMIQHLEERAWSYHGAYEAEVETANRLIGEFRAAIFAQESADIVKAKFNLAMDAVHAASRAKGRGELVNAYWSILDDKPSALESDLWLQGQASNVEENYRQLDRLAAALKAAQESADLERIVGASQDWVSYHGELTGRVDELGLLQANIASYYRAKDERDARRRAAFSAFLGSLGKQLANRRADFVPLRPNVTIHCKEYFSGTQCRTQ